MFSNFLAFLRDQFRNDSQFAVTRPCLFNKSLDCTTAKILDRVLIRGYARIAVGRRTDRRRARTLQGVKQQTRRDNESREYKRGTACAPYSLVVNLSFVHLRFRSRHDATFASARKKKAIFISITDERKCVRKQMKKIITIYTESY